MIKTSIVVEVHRKIMIYSPEKRSYLSIQDNPPSLRRDFTKGTMFDERLIRMEEIEEIKDELSIKFPGLVVIGVVVSLEEYDLEANCTPREGEAT